MGKAKAVKKTGIDQLNESIADGRRMLTTKYLNELRQYVTLLEKYRRHLKRQNKTPTKVGV